ncbi:hypothetical protein [Desulfopila sp. IMCC35008]|uniref:hypothetical protein n=1 Tax=Desulfopila sp. IMCC35008 TaxID=2653858 RepID=UPI0013D11D58|nr:hypothetical protein [Desulfopila sp. IMCC35008]
MSPQNENDRPHSRRRQIKRSPLPWFLAFLVVITGILAYFLYFDRQSPPLSGQIDQHLSDNAVDSQSGSGSSQPSGRSGTNHPLEDVTDNTDYDAAEAEPLPDGSSTVQEDILKAPSTEKLLPLGDPESEFDQTDLGLNCSPSILTIKDFYSHLDQQDYLTPYQLDKPSEMYFSDLLQKVVDNPPIVTGETDDLFNILQNTAHFFRIVGKKNIFTLKAILDREKDSFENVLAEFYKLTESPSCLKEGFDLMIPDTALYDYAGFFLNTMGGRLYLFRRDSVSRLAVSYYSILIVDKANSNGTNKHGIDIGPAIRSLIDELENSGSRLRLRDDYLDKLYNLEEKYM